MVEASAVPNGTFESIDPLRVYLKEIRRRPLLTAAQEIEFAQVIEEGRSAMLIDSPESKSKIEAACLARGNLVESNLRLVVPIARRYIGRGMDLLDLIEEGNIGLIDAVDGYDPKRGWRFSTYATPIIRWSVLRAIDEQRRIICLTVHACEAERKLLRVESELEQLYGRHVTREELIEASGFTRELVNGILIANNLTSLDQLAGDDEDSLGSKFLADSGQTPQQLAERNELSEELRNRLEKIKPRSRFVLNAYFGIDEVSRTGVDIGLDLGVTNQRVHQIVREGFNEVRALPDAEKLQELILW